MIFHKKHCRGFSPWNRHEFLQVVELKRIVKRRNFTCQDNCGVMASSCEANSVAAMIENFDWEVSAAGFFTIDRTLMTGVSKGPLFMYDLLAFVKDLNSFQIFASAMTYSIVLFQLNLAEATSCFPNGSVGAFHTGWWEELKGQISVSSHISYFLIHYWGVLETEIIVNGTNFAQSNESNGSSSADPKMSNFMYYSFYTWNHFRLSPQMFLSSICS